MSAKRAGGFFHLSLAPIKAEQGRRADRRVRGYIKRTLPRFRMADSNGLKRTRDYQTRAADGDAHSEVAYYEYRDCGSGLAADALFDRVDRGRRRKSDGHYKANAGRLPNLGIFVTASLPYGMSLERAKTCVGDLLTFLERQYSAAAEAVIHRKGEHYDHVHIVMTDVAVGPNGVSPTKIRELDGIGQKCRGNGVYDGGRLLAPAAEAIRGTWARILTEATGITHDHRSYARQGVDLTPVTYVSRQDIDVQKRLGIEDWRMSRAEELEYREKFLEEKRLRKGGGGVGDGPIEKTIRDIFIEHLDQMNFADMIVDRFIQAARNVSKQAERLSQVTTDREVSATARSSPRRSLSRQRSASQRQRKARHVRALRMSSSVMIGRTRAARPMTPRATTGLDLGVGISIDVLHVLLKLFRRRKRTRKKGAPVFFRSVPRPVATDISDQPRKPTGKRSPQSGEREVAGLELALPSDISAALPRKEGDDVVAAPPLDSQVPPSPVRERSAAMLERGGISIADATTASQTPAVVTERISVKPQLPNDQDDSLGALQTPTVRPLPIADATPVTSPRQPEPGPINGASHATTAEIGLGGVTLDQADTARVVCAAVAAWRVHRQWHRDGNRRCAAYLGLSEDIFDRRVAAVSIELFRGDKPASPKAIKEAAIQIFAQRSEAALLQLFEMQNAAYLAAKNQRRKLQLQKRREKGPSIE